VNLARITTAANCKTRFVDASRLDRERATARWAASHSNLMACSQFGEDFPASFGHSGRYDTPCDER
jgi:hypothetical protein